MKTLMCSRRAYRLILLTTVLGLAALAPGSALAQEEPAHYVLRLEEGPLDAVLKAFVAETEVGLVYEPTLVADKRARCTRQEGTAEEWLACILGGTGLSFRRLPSGGYALYPRAEQAPPARTAPQRQTVSGYVQDAATGERLIGATVYVPALGVGAVTNRYGFFSLTLPRGTYAVQFSYIGYESETQEVALAQDRMQTVLLEPQAVLLDSLVVMETRTEPIEARVQMGTVAVAVEQIEAAPALLGEVDVLRTLQLLPGVKTGQEAMSGLYIRGGGPDQNLILLDGVPVYNANHIFGIFSVFNTDAVNHIQLTKGGFPARFGGRLSSVVEVNLKEGNLNEFVTKGSVGLLASRLTVEGPLAEGRTSFIVSGRRTYADLLARPFLEMQRSGDKPVAYFYDLTAKVNHILSPSDRVFFSIYRGADRYGIDTEYEPEDPASGAPLATESMGRIGWGNVTSALRWNHLFSNKLFSNTTLTYSRYRFGAQVEQTERLPEGDRTEGIDYFSGIQDLSGRIDFDYVPSPRHYVRFGAHATHHTFTPSTLQFVAPAGEALPDSVGGVHRVRAVELSAYAEDELQVTDRLAVNVGLHASAFRVEDQLYPSLQPRVSARYLLPGAVALKGSFAAMRQYIHLLVNSGTGLPTDLWVPATSALPPEEAWQASAGLARTFAGGRYEASLEGYYKEMDNLLHYREGATYASASASYEDQVTLGEGRGYGLEVFLQRRTGRTRGWIGYTLAWADRRFDELNRGRRFPHRYDRRHDLNLTLTHRLSQKADVSLSWVYSTGNAVTLPTARYVVTTEPYASEGGGPYGGTWTVDYYPSVNAFRMPAYHRLDLGLNWYFARRPGREAFLSVGVYNAYNRKNPFYLRFEEGRSAATGYALMPAIPSLSYTFLF